VEANAKNSRVHGREGLSPGFDDADSEPEVGPLGIVGVFLQLNGPAIEDRSRTGQAGVAFRRERRWDFRRKKTG